MIANDKPHHAPAARLPFADGLRAIALLGLVAFELVAWTRDPHVPGPVLAVAAGAANFAALFFAVAGFLLALPLLSTLRTAGSAGLNLPRYAAARLLRILPAYALVLGATALVPLAAQHYGFTAFHGRAPQAPALLRALFFSGSSFGNDGFWALAVLVRCYLAFPLLLLLWNRFPRAFLALAAIAAAADATTPAHAWGCGALLPFMLGIVAADIDAHRPVFARFALPLAGGAFVAAALLDPLISRLPGPLSAGAPFPENPLFAIAFAALIVGAARTPPLARGLAVAPLASLGRSSYAVSLVAVPAISFAYGYARHQTTLGLGLEAVALIAVAAYPLRHVVAKIAALGARLPALPLVPSLTLNFRSAVTYARRDGDDPQSSASAQASAPAPAFARVKIPVVSLRFGTFEDLVSEISEAKQRLVNAAGAFDNDFSLAPYYAFERDGGGRKSLPSLGPRVSIRVRPSLAATEAYHA